MRDDEVKLRCDFRQCLHTLSCHNSTVRCLKLLTSDTCLSGSRDGTIHLWDIRRGLCLGTLVGHTASVRCLTVAGFLVASGSYDKTARVWDITPILTASRLVTGDDYHHEMQESLLLEGHTSQIYSIAADSQRVVTGSLDTTIRVWNIING